VLANSLFGAVGQWWLRVVVIRERSSGNDGIMIRRVI